MTEFIIWSFLLYGLSNIVVYGKIFNTPREFIKQQSENEKNIMQSFFVFLRDMSSCMMCFPVWAGFIVGLFFYSPSFNILNINLFGSWFFDGILASGTTWFLNSIVEWFEENRPKN